MSDVNVRYSHREGPSDRMWTLNNHLTEEQRPRVAEWLHMLGVERVSWTAVSDPGPVRVEFRRSAPQADLDEAGVSILAELRAETALSYGENTQPGLERAVELVVGLLRARAERSEP